MRNILFLLVGLFSISLSAQIDVVTRIYIDGTPYDVLGGADGGSLLNVVEDLTPQLGGNLDINTKSFVGNILPSVTNTDNLGSGTFRWLNTYVSGVDLDGNLLFTPTDVEPTGTEGRLYFDDSENTLKQHNGISWEAVGSGAGGTDDQIALEVPYTPSGTIAATNVQNAVEELDTEKQSSLNGSSYVFGDTAGLKILANGSLNQITTTNNLQFINGALALVFTISGSAQTVTGATGASLYFPTISVNDDAYAVGWNTNTDIPTKNAVYDKIETISAGIQEHPDSGQTGIRIGSGTEAERALATLVPGSDIWISSDANPSETTTGTVLDMSGYAQTDDRVVDTATFTLSDIRDGGYHEVLINEATEPNITGASKLPNTAAFITATEMLMCVKVFGTDVRYFFVEW